jgi:hypothetical protein
MCEPHDGVQRVSEVLDEKLPDQDTAKRPRPKRTPRVSRQKTR